MNQSAAKVAKLDGRRVKSREKLKQALAKLLLDKSLEKITIEEVAKAAAVTRPTFYSNYRDLQAIVIEYVDELMSTLVQEFEKIDSDKRISPRDRVTAIILYYIEMLQENDCILLSTAAGRAGNEALDLMRRYGMQIILVRASKLPDLDMQQHELEIAMHFVSGSINTVLEAHASGKLEYPPQQVAEYVTKLVYEGLGKELGDPDKLMR
ncbi:TetR/AcrR family transcriptional regulator [Hirschia maritima]|uniref:TetR/AcrR family transcriptional regulator n=1 Tax=Hirschia maritima TaxID=1121961 RepID=UPI00035F8FC1|nr:TetR/AcrR family transcriptional regulator [Hirschia maritima]